MRAHIFDMDGTLLPGTTATIHLAAAFGHDAFLAQIEADFAAGTMSAVEFARTLHREWGVVTPARARAAFDAAPQIGHVAAVLADLHERGEHACLITMSPAYFAEHFLELGFDAVFATPYPADADTLLDERLVLSPRDKPRLARAFCAERGLRLEDAVAYGDSMSDVPLFGEVGFALSVNGDHHLAPLCHAEVRTDDLREAYAVARAWCDA